MIGADYSTKFSPWLAHGCLSPRTIHDEVVPSSCSFIFFQSEFAHYILCMILEQSLWPLIKFHVTGWMHTGKAIRE